VSTWVNVLEARRAREFKGLPKLEKSWRVSQRKRSKMDPEEKVWPLFFWPDAGHGMRTALADLQCDAAVYIAPVWRSDSCIIPV